MTSDDAIEWLLEEDQPAIRYLALRQLRGKRENDPEVESAKARIPKEGWAADILEEQNRGGWWVTEESLYLPKYLSTNWMLLILSDLGLTKEHPGIRRACELWIERFATPDGGFGAEGAKTGHLCIVGNTARALVRFGYADHPKVRSALAWLEDHRDKNGGWSCFGSGRNLDSWEGLSAFAVYPREQWTPGMTRAVQDAAEFFLQRELHTQGGPYAPWTRFHYPVHYYYDVLVGLDLLTALGHVRDPRLQYGISLLKKKRRQDGRWTLDALHPDVEGKMAEWYASHPKRTPTPFGLETPGEPSKMITLRARTVLGRVGKGVNAVRRRPGNSGSSRPSP